MIRKLKVLGLAAVAIAAMSMMVSSAAQAAPYWFKTDAGAGATTTLVGQQQTRPGNLVDQFTFTSGSVKCTATHYTGSVVGPTVSTVTLHPEFSGCSGPFSVTVTTTGCNYVFHTEEATAGGVYHATMTLDCEVGRDVTMVVKLAGITKCTIHIEPQDLGTLTLTNGTKVNGRKDVHADINLSGIRYTETAGEGIGSCATGSTHSNGTYVGTATFTGLNEGTGAETDIFLE